MNCYKVIYSKSGKRVGSDTFDNYDDALSFAIESSDFKGYLCVLLAFDSKKGCWHKRCTIYPNENC